MNKTIKELASKKKQNNIKKFLKKESVIKKFKIKKEEKELSTLSALYASGCHGGMQNVSM